MADKTIGQLPVSAGLDDNSLLVTEQGGEARSITGALVKRFAKDSVAEETAKAEQAAKDVAAAKTSVDEAKASVDQSKASIDQTKAAIDGIKTDIDTAKTAIDQAQLEIAQDKLAAEEASQSAGTSATSAEENAKKVAAALEEAGGIVEEVTGLRDDAMNTVKSAVLFTEQNLTDTQKEQAKANIGAPFDRGPSGTVKWNGSTSNLVSITVNANAELNYAGDTYYLMPRTSSKVPPAATLEALGGSYTYQTGADEMGDEGIVPVLATVSFGAGNGNLDSTSYPGATIVDNMAIVVHAANTPLYDITVEKPGVYFRKYYLSTGNVYPAMVTEMTLTGGTLDDGLERLPEKFLPEGVAMESYVDDKIDEASPFLVTLTDGKANCKMEDLWYRRNDRAGVYLLDANGERLHMTGVTEQEVPVLNNQGEIIRYRYEYYATFARALPSFPALAGITLYGSSLSATATAKSYSTKTMIATDGGTMTGALTLAGAPTANLHAATKQYVDEKATWEALPDKPTIFEGGDTLTWDGDTTGRLSAAGMFYKVSDAIPELGDFADGATLYISGDLVGYEDGHYAADTFQTMFEGVVMGPKSLAVFVSQSAVGVDLDGMTFEEPGTYFMLTSGIYIESLTIPGYTGFGKEVIDPDYLPESVKGGSGGVVYVNAAIPEDYEPPALVPLSSIDKTYGEIMSHLDAGEVVIVIVDMVGTYAYLPLSNRVEFDGEGILAFGSVQNLGGINYFELTVMSDNSTLFQITSMTATS